MVNPARTIAVAGLTAATALLIAAPSASAAPATGRNFTGHGSTHTAATNNAIQNASNAGWGGCKEISASQSGGTWTSYVNCIFQTS